MVRTKKHYPKGPWTLLHESIHGLVLQFLAKWPEGEEDPKQRDFFEMEDAIIQVFIGYRRIQPLPELEHKARRQALQCSITILLDREIKPNTIPNKRLRAVRDIVGILDARIKQGYPWVLAEENPEEYSIAKSQPRKKKPTNLIKKKSWKTQNGNVPVPVVKTRTRSASTRKTAASTALSARGRSTSSTR
jgi:hypothetical protein